MYNAIFGENPRAGALLACIGLTKADVGRYRDVWLTDKHIAVYTRNGGGNRECAHEDSPKYGDQRCKHHEVKEMVKEYLELPEDEIKEKGYELLNIYCGGKRGCHTGRTVEQTFYVCEEPSSESCHCYGCFMTYHVHKLPHYSHDEDDDFDSTYATIYFNFPPEYEAELKSLADPEAMSGDERWHHFFEKLTTPENAPADSEGGER